MDLMLQLYWVLGLLPGFLIKRAVHYLLLMYMHSSFHSKIHLPVHGALAFQLNSKARKNFEAVGCPLPQCMKNSSQAREVLWPHANFSWDITTCLAFGNEFLIYVANKILIIRSDSYLIGTFPPAFPILYNFNKTYVLSLHQVLL